MLIKSTLFALSAASVAVLGVGALTHTAEASTSTSQSTTAGITTAGPTAAAACARNYAAIPAHWSTEKGGLDIGRLTKVTSKKGVVTIRLDRVTFYTGAEAKALNGGKVPADGYTEVDLDSKQRSYTLDPKSSIYAALDLRTHPEIVGREKLTLAQFVHNAGRPDTRKAMPLVWVRHTDGLKGTITAVGEQYVP